MQFFFIDFHELPSKVGHSPAYQESIVCIVLQRVMNM